MYSHLVDFGTPQFDEMLKLRDDLLRKPLGLTFQEEDISAEYDSIHLGCYSDSGQLIGCLVLLPISKDEIKMRQVAVKESWQRKGIGQFLVERSEIEAKKLGYQLMTLHARNTVVKFYTRLNYDKIGKPFKEVSVKHYKMQKKI